MEPQPSRITFYKKKTIQNANFWASLLVILFLISGISTLQNYGLTWDEGLGNLFFGERYFHYFTSLNPKYLDFNADLNSLSSYPLHLYLSPFHDRPNEFPPLADSLSAATMYVFSYGLKWLNPIDGYHLFTIILAAIFLWAIYRFAEPKLGKFAAIMALLFLGTFPRFWADMHFNVKDVPETIFFGLTLMTYWWWYEKPSLLKALGTGILMGGALGVKANAIFILPILFITIFPLSFRKREIHSSIAHFRKYLWHYLLMGVSSLTIYVISWPYLYADVFTRLKSYWVYIFSQGGRNMDTSWNIDPIREVLTTMPEIMLLAFVIGVVLVFRQAWKDTSPYWRLLLLWAIIPILRTSVPGAVNFDGIRHFLEFVPAFALIAGYGVSRVACSITEKYHIPKLILQLGILVLLIANLVQINLRYYPYLHLYYNGFIGGFAGARDKFLGTEATDYWASSYRQGMEWLNQNSPANSRVSTLIAPWIVEISAPVFLRPDIQVVSQLPDFEIMKQSNDPYFLMFILRGGGDAQDEIDYTRHHGKLVYQIVVDHVPILEIYQFGGN